MSIMSNMQRVSLLRNVPIRSPTTGAVEQRLQSVGSIDMAIYQDDTLRISQTVQGDVTSHIAMRLEGSFADGVRGLMVYGTGVLRDKSAVTAQIEYVDEPATQVNVINTTDAPVNTKEVAGA